MKNILEIRRIIESGIKGQRSKVVAYANQLARKIEAEDPKSSLRIRKSIEQSERDTPSSILPSAGSFKQLPTDNESRLALADRVSLESGSVPIILNQEIQQSINQFMRFVKAADDLLAEEMSISPTMIIYGAPGVGKTELAKHIAAELELPILVARSDALISSYLGSTAKNIRSLFEYAAETPCVLFLDEIDSLAKMRDDQHELGELKRVVISLLQNIDILNNQTVLLAATNHPHLLDPAVWRRFAYKMELSLPEAEQREKLFLTFLGHHKLEGTLLQPVRFSKGLTGANIRQICETVIRESILSENKIISSINLTRQVIEFRTGKSQFLNHFSESAVNTLKLYAEEPLSNKEIAQLFDISEPTVSRHLRAKKKEDK